MTDKNTLDLAREWADHVQYGKALDDVQAARKVIDALPDTIVDGDKLREVVADHHLDMSDELMEALGALLPSPESSAPRPEDVPEGETWLIRPYENADPAPAFRVHASKYGPGKRWAYFRVGGSMIGFADDDDVTLIARMVPETAEHDDGQVFDPAYIYTDTDGCEWEYLDGRWIAGTTHVERVAARKVRSGIASPSAEFGPYTRIEDNK